MKAIILVLALAFTGSACAEDMQRYLKETRDLAAQGKHEEALKRFVWFHEHALEHDESMYGVRLSFALNYWKSLGESYPPAMKALVKLRDGNDETLRENKGNKNLFHDVMAINETLEEPGKSLELFEFISKADPDRAKRYWSLAKDLIFENKRFDLARKYITDVKAEFEGIKAVYERQMALYEDPGVGGAQFRKYNENTFIREVRELVEFALAVGERDAAIGIRDAAMAVIGDDRFKGLIPEPKTEHDRAGQPDSKPGPE